MRRPRSPTWGRTGRSRFSYRGNYSRTCTVVIDQPRYRKYNNVGETMFTTLLIIHGLIAVALLGSITHQTAAACWPAAKGGSVVSSFRAVAGARYTIANIILYV